MAPPSLVGTHTSKRKQLSLLLGLVLVGLFGVIAWLELDLQPNAQGPQQNITRITIQRADFADIELANNNGQWQLNAPYSLNANSQRLEPLLSLATTQLDSYETTDVDMPATGLNAPQASFTLNERAFSLGVPHIDGNRRYTLVDGKVTFLPEWVWSLVHGGVSAFADLTVFKTIPDDLYLISEDGTIQTPNAESWSALQADRIVNEAFEANGSNVISQWWLGTTDTPSVEAKLADIIQFDERTLIRTEPAFAYAISNATFNGLIGR